MNGRCDPGSDRAGGQLTLHLGGRVVRRHGLPPGPEPRRALRGAERLGGEVLGVVAADEFGLGGAESYPGVFGPFGGFADDAEVENGFVPLSERPGIGFEGQAALYAIMRALAA